MKLLKLTKTIIFIIQLQVHSQHPDKLPASKNEIWKNLNVEDDEVNISSNRLEKENADNNVPMVEASKVVSI